MSLKELECQGVILQHPRSWSAGQWCNGLNLDFNNPYHSSAVLAAHVENTTYPLRSVTDRLANYLVILISIYRVKDPAKLGLGRNTLDLSSLTDFLDWRQASPFSHVRGVLPLVDADASSVVRRLYDFSGGDRDKLGDVVSRTTFKTLPRS